MHLKCLVLLFPLLLKVVYILKLIHVDRIHLKIKHIELVLHNILSLLLHCFCLIKAFFYQKFDILVLDVARAHSKNFICSKIDHVLELILLESSMLWCKSSFLDNKRVKFKLHGLFFNHLFFHGVRSNQTEDLNNLLLSNTMSAIHCLEINLGIPITVIENNYIGSHEVKTESTSSGRYEEYKFLGVFFCKFFNIAFSLIKISVSVESTIVIFAEKTVIFKNIKH